MRRGPDQTRYFLEIPGTDTVAGWPEQQVRGELTARLGVGARLDDVPLGEFGLLDMRMRMIEPMQQGRLFLAGDAAHLITPADGKGTNLAIQGRRRAGPRADRALRARQRPPAAVAYSDTRLPHIWRTQAFSTGTCTSTSPASMTGKNRPPPCPAVLPTG